MFQIYSTEDVYVTKVTLYADSAPSGETDMSVFIEDESMDIVDIMTVNQTGGMGLTEFVFDKSVRPSLLSKGSKMEAYYNDDPTDSVTKLLFVMDYLYIPPTTNG